MGAYSVIEYGNAKKALEKRFEDVLYSEVELAVRAAQEEVIVEVLSSAAPVYVKYEIAEKYNYPFSS